MIAEPNGINRVHNNNNVMNEVLPIHSSFGALSGTNNAMYSGNPLLAHGNLPNMTCNGFGYSNAYNRNLTGIGLTSMAPNFGDNNGRPLPNSNPNLFNGGRNKQPLNQNMNMNMNMNRSMDMNRNMNMNFSTKFLNGNIAINKLKPSLSIANPSNLVTTTAPPLFYNPTPDQSIEQRPLSQFITKDMIHDSNHVNNDTTCNSAIKNNDIINNNGSIKSNNINNAHVANNIPNFASIDPRSYTQANRGESFSPSTSSSSSSSTLSSPIIQAKKPLDISTRTCCDNCGATDSCAWRPIRSLGQKYCNACAIYYRR